MYTFIGTITGLVLGYTLGKSKGYYDTERLQDFDEFGEKQEYLKENYPIIYFLNRVLP